jgi:hypothetical protein
MLLLDESFLHNPDNLIALYHLVKSDIWKKQRENLRDTSYLNLRWTNNEDPELNKFRSLREDIFSRLISIWKLNPKVILDMYYHQKIYTNTDKNHFISTLYNIGDIDPNMEEYILQIWLNMLPVNGRVINYDMTIIHWIWSNISRRCINRYSKKLDKAEGFTDGSIREHPQKIDMYFWDNFF